MPRKNPQPALPGLGQQTTPQQLSAIIKSARDKMRKDKGLSGDTDRLPQLTWIMFLKFLDDNERLRESEANLAGEKFKLAIAPPYRWRDWAGVSNGLTGDDLIAFINNDDALRPDGKRGPGLFPYLRGLTGENGGDRRDVIANVFRGTLNRMVSGYILREVLQVIDAINFTSSEEIHTLSALYESMLKEMRDAAGDAGEFYTPRAVVRFMVKMVNPRLGESVLDPACGTGGFLVETFEHIRQECDTVEKLERLQRGTIFGIEAKPLPYLLCQMNLLLHGLEFPHIDYTNSLAVRIGEIGERERVDVILTNPPFGGEEERSILQNFPADKQTTETTLLFLQLIMRKLRRLPKGGRAAIVVPNGMLFGDGVAAKIKEELLAEFNLHTIVRLPEGVFSPYTGIPTNIIFFDRDGPTDDVWYYEIPSRDGGRYSKSKPMQFEEFQECMKWWQERVENEFAWKVPGQLIIDRGCNLDRRNPNRQEDIEHQPPEYLAKSIMEKELRIINIMNEITKLLEKDSEE